MKTLHRMRVYLPDVAALPVISPIRPKKRASCDDV